MYDKLLPFSLVHRLHWGHHEAPLTPGTTTTMLSNTRSPDKKPEVPTNPSVWVPCSSRPDGKCHNWTPWLILLLMNSAVMGQAPFYSIYDIHLFAKIFLEILCHSSNSMSVVKARRWKGNITMAVLFTLVDSCRNPSHKHPWDLLAVHTNVLYNTVDSQWRTM